MILLAQIDRKQRFGEKNHLFLSSRPPPKASLGFQSQGCSAVLLWGPVQLFSCSVGTGSALEMTHCLNLASDPSAVALMDPIVCLLYSLGIRKGRWKMKSKVRKWEDHRQPDRPFLEGSAPTSGLGRTPWTTLKQTQDSKVGAVFPSGESRSSGSCFH